MRTTISLDDVLLAKAQKLTGISQKSAVVQEALTALVQRESARRLSLLGGSEPDLKLPPLRTMIFPDSCIWIDYLSGLDHELAGLLARTNCVSSIRNRRDCDG